MVFIFSVVLDTGYFFINVSGVKLTQFDRFKVPQMVFSRLADMAC